MPKGGARARSGPAPDPNALRRDKDGDQWENLPRDGRKGAAPAWPLTKATARETLLWKREWKRPQAVMWERNGQELEVALYIRSLVDAEKKNAPTNARTLVRQQQEALGLSLPGLARNRWRIEEEVAPSVTKPSRSSKSTSAKSRFRVLDGGGS